MTDINSFFENTKEIEGKDLLECSKYFDDESILTYVKVEQKYKINDLKIFYDETNRPYCLIHLHREREGDLTSHFECNVKYTIFLENNRCEEIQVDRIISIGAVYTQVYLKIYLDQFNMPDEIIFSRRWYHLPPLMRKKIACVLNPDGIIDGDLMYRCGICWVRRKE